jgi:ABC-type uncharacterized transport system substrate-binding protein
MRRRDVIKAMAGAAAAWPLAARAQQSNRLPVIGIAMPLAADDPEGRARIAEFRHRLQELGLTVGHDVQIEYRWGAGDADLNRRNAADLVNLAPAVILATGSPTLEPLLQATHTLPIVFVQIADPVGAGLVESLSHPGSNATDFTTNDLQRHREMAGASQGDRAADNPRRPTSGSVYCGRDRAVGRCGGVRTVVRAGIASGQCWRRQ